MPPIDWPFGRTEAVDAVATTLLVVVVVAGQPLPEPLHKCQNIETNWRVSAQLGSAAEKESSRLLLLLSGDELDAHQQTTRNGRSVLLRHVL